MMRKIYQSSRFGDKNAFTDRKHKTIFPRIISVLRMHGRVRVHGATLVVMEPSSDQLPNFWRDLLWNV